MERLKRLLIVLSIILALTLIVSGCNQTENGDGKNASKAGGDFNYFLLEPVAIDPLNIVESEGIKVANQLFDGLIAYDPKNMEVIPAVAKSWESNEDATVFTFKLKEGTKFHNGDAVTAEDFKYAWERVADPDSQSMAPLNLFEPILGFNEMMSGDATSVVGIKVIDDHELEVTLNQPFSEFIKTLGHPVFSPVSKKAIEDDPKGFADNPVGNGPFMMASPWEHGKEIKIKRFDDYYGKKAYLDTVDFKIFAEKETGFLEFKAGSLDFVPIPIGQVKATVEEFGDNAIVGLPQQSITFIGFNLNKKPFKDNKYLRRAIGEALNRPGMADAIFENTQIPAVNIVPPIGKVDKDQDEKARPDTSKAKKDLKKAGYPNGDGLKPVKLAYRAGFAEEEQLAQAIQSDLKKIGVSVALNALEEGAFYDGVFDGTLQMFILSVTADYPSPDGLLYPLFNSGSQFNFFGYDDKKVDVLLDDERRTLDEDERDDIFKKIEKEVLSDRPMTPLLYVGSASLHQRDVEGVVINAQDVVPLERVRFKE